MSLVSDIQAVFAFAHHLLRKKRAQNVVQVNQQIGQPQPSTGTEEEMLKIATSQFEHIESQIRFADTKAQLILAADAFLAGAIGKGDIKGLLPIMHINHYFVSLTNILSLLALAGSFFCALIAVIPRKSKNLREDIGPTAQNTRLIPLVWSQIANVDTKLNEKPWDAFINSFDNQTSTGLKNSILTETFIKARNAQKKYKYVRLSIYCLFAVLALWLITQLLLALSY